MMMTWFRQVPAVTAARRHEIIGAAGGGGAPATLADFRPGVEEFKGARPIMITYIPRSGAPALANILQRVTGYGYLNPTMGGKPLFHSDLYLPDMLEFAGKGYISTLHCLANERNIALVQAFRMHVIVLIRAIPEAIVALGEYLEAVDHRANLFYRGFYDARSVEAKLDFLIDLYAPNLIYFYYSWVEAQKRGLVELLWMRYEDLMECPQQAVQQMAEVLGLESPPEDAYKGLAQGLEAERIKQWSLSDRQRQKIDGLLRHFPGTDFSRLECEEAVCRKGAAV